MDIKELIVGTFEDYWNRFDNALEGLTSEELAWRPQGDCNPISFIAWHMARVEDRYVHHFAMDAEEVWVKNAWFTQCGLEASDTGLRFTLEQVAAFPALALDMLSGYMPEVRRETRAYLQQLQVQDLDVVPGWFAFAPNTPPESDKWSIGHVFRQLVGELNQHLGQVSYLRGMVKGFNSQRPYTPPYGKPRILLTPGDSQGL
jgi:DinB superfamily